MGNNTIDKWRDISPENKLVIENYCRFRRNTCKKSFSTVSAEENTLRKLARFLNKPLKDATEDDMISFFGDTTVVGSLKSRDLYGVQLCTFYRHILKLRRKERPLIMDWFYFSTKAEKKKQVDPDAYEKFFIQPDEYQKMIDFSSNSQDKALWQTMYLTGARPSEIASMKVDGVKEVPNGYEVTVYKSKTIPRKIPLSQTPEHLLYWVRNHPHKNDNDTALWVSNSRKSVNEPLLVSGIKQKFTALIKSSNLKKTLTPRCFRKTRASIMFNDPEVGNDDKLMAEFFGWSISQVPLRRLEYDLRTHDTLRDKIFKNGIKKQPSYDELKIEKEKAERYAKRIEELEKQMSVMKDDLFEKLKAEFLKPETIKMDYNEIKP